MADRQPQDPNRQAQQGQDQTGRQSQQQQGQQGDTRQQGQQGQQDQSRQPQQFQAQQNRQPMSAGAAGRLADQIREHQEVVDASGRHIGTVDHVQGDRIKLARSDSSDGEHHYVMLSQVAGIEGGKVCLRERGDNDYGMEAGQS